MALWSPSRSLQRKIITAIVLVGLLPLSLVLGLSYLEERRAWREAIGANFKGVAVETARRLEMEVTRGINEAQQLATTPFLRTALTEANRAYLGKSEDRIQAMIRDWQGQWRSRERQQDFPIFINRIVTNYLIRWHEIRKLDYVGIFVTDRHGALVVTSIPQVEYYYGKAPWWRAVTAEAQGRPFVGEIQFDPVFGTHVLNLSVPIWDDEQRQMLGVVTVLVRRDSLVQVLSEVTIGTSGHAMLIGSDGAVLICPVMPPEAHAVTAALAEAVVAGQGGWVVADDDAHGGRDSVVGYASMRLPIALAPESFGGRRWLVLVRQHPQETYAPLTRLLVKVSAYGAGVLALLWGFGMLAARRLVQPIRLLQQGAQRIGTGDLDARIAVHTGDELDQLAQAINGMAGNLKGSITQLQQRHAEIENTKRYLESLLENANDVIYTLDAEQRFTYVNSKVSAWGYTKDELIGRPYLSLLSKRHRGRRLKNTLDIGNKQVYEVEVLAKGGEARSVMVSVAPLQDPGGQVLGVLGIARDVTDTKKLEQQIRNSEKLASVGKLAAGVAHEVNNPLGGILNCVYNLRKGMLSPARQEEYLLSMEDGLRRVQKIVRQLLEFSQQHEPELRPTNLNAVIDRVLVLTNHAFTANQIRLDRRLDSALPVLMVDPHMMEQVLMNLILNAVQAIKGGGVITIRTRAQDDQCVVDVEDTGCGMPQSVIARIFDPFFTTKGQGEGTGLGLSVSLGIVEKHGGHILVTSEVGKGSLFTVCLPVSKDQLPIEAMR
jgi:PAS domain S-box-containing protein